MEKNQLHLIVGLGNPGRRYANNRHNIGFRTVEQYAAQKGAGFTRTMKQAEIAESWIDSPVSVALQPVPHGQIEPAPARKKCLLAKPQTYMNRSGEVVAGLVRYFKIPTSNILIIHDDLDLPTAKVRLRPGGGSGGQNGIKSIIQALGTPDFARLRIGIDRPPGTMPAAAYVLQDFTLDEVALFAPLADTLCAAIDSWLFEGVERAMNRFN